MKQQLEETLNKLAVDRLPPEARNNLPKIKAGLLKWGELMDDLGRRDEQSGEIFVDEGGLRKLLGEHFPEASVQQTIGALQGLPGSKVKKATGKTSVIPGRLWPRSLAATLVADSHCQCRPASTRHPRLRRSGQHCSSSFRGYRTTCSMRRHSRAS